MVEMLHIYLNAHFVISAASVSNCDQGFLKQKDSDLDKAFFILRRVDKDTIGSALISEDSSS